MAAGLFWLGVVGMGLADEGEVELDAGGHVDGAAVEEGGGVAPLADGLFGGGDEHGVAADELDVADGAVASDGDIESDFAFEAGLAGLSGVSGLGLRHETGRGDDRGRS